MFLSLGGIQVDAFVGINWGRMAKQRFVPSMVVDLLLQNGITELRIFQPSLNVLDAFADTNIGMTITLQENFLRNVREQKEIDAMIHERVKNFVDKGVKFRYMRDAMNSFLDYCYFLFQILMCPDQLTSTSTIQSDHLPFFFFFSIYLHLNSGLHYFHKFQCYYFISGLLLDL